MTDYDFYRLDDRIFYAFLAAALIFCAVHAARRAFRQPRATDDPGPLPDSPVAERHTRFQRIYHWSNAVGVIVLALSGWMIYRPAGIPGPEKAPSEWFLWHSWAAALFLAGIAAHMVYESFLVQDTNPMALNRAEGRRIVLLIKNFFGLTRSYPPAGKYHAGQIFFHWAVAADLFLLLLTGMALWKPLRGLLPLSLLGLGWDFIYFSRILHGFFSAALIACLIIHFYFALFIQKNWPEAKSMITGRTSG